VLAELYKPEEPVDRHWTVTVMWTPYFANDLLKDHEYQLLFSLQLHKHVPFPLRLDLLVHLHYFFHLSCDIPLWSKSQIFFSTPFPFSLLRNRKHLYRLELLYQHHCR
jgi:hypothetical protein